MSPSRLFVSHAALEAWIADGRVSVEGDTLTLVPEGQRFALVGGAHFDAELTGAQEGDPLVGKVKDLEQIRELGGEHAAGSVLLGERAYEVTDGLVGVPIPAPAAEPEVSRASELDTLAALLLERRGG